MAEAYILQDASLIGLVVQPVHGEIEMIGLSIYHEQGSLLVVEETELYRGWLLYVREDNTWVLAREFQVRFFESSEDSVEDEMVTEELDESVDE